MTSTFHLNATRRPAHLLKRGANRRLRRDHKIPGIIYGKHLEHPVPIALDEKLLLKALSHEGFYGHILTIDVEGKPQKVILRAIDRNPAKRKQILHIDFQQISAHEKITMWVSLHVEGQDKCTALSSGGVLNRLYSEVEIRCLPKDLPEHLAVDISGMCMHDVIHLSQIKLPKGVELLALHQGEGHDHPVVSIHEPRLVVEAEAAPATAEVPTAAEGAEKGDKAEKSDKKADDKG